MARRKDDGCSGKARLTTRRTLLKAAGVTALTAGAGGLVGTAGAEPITGAETVVDLGEEGLSDGDSIDPYLETHFASNTAVYVPAGEYTYTGAGLSGTYSKAALLGSSAGVVLRRPEDPETAVRPTITATDGTVRLENLTIAGERGRTQSRWRLGAEAGASVAAVNVNMPDGTVADAESMGIHASADHAGLLWVANCHFGNFGNVAVDAADPYKGGNGSVVVENCDFVDSGATALTLGADDSAVRDCYFEAGPDAAGHRAIAVSGPGSDLTIADCDFEWADAAAAPIDFQVTSAGGDGTIADVRMAAAGDHGPVAADWSVERAWTGENINVTEV